MEAEDSINGCDFVYKKYFSNKGSTELFFEYYTDLKEQYNYGMYEMPEKALLFFLESQNSFIIDNLCSNGNKYTDIKFVENFWSKSYEQIVENKKKIDRNFIFFSSCLAKNDEVSVENLEKIFSLFNDDVFVITDLLKNKNLPNDLLLRISETKNYHIYRIIASQSDLPQNVIKNLIQNNNAKIFKDILANSSLSQENVDIAFSLSCETDLVVSSLLLEANKLSTEQTFHFFEKTKNSNSNDLLGYTDTIVDSVAKYYNKNEEIVKKVMEVELFFPSISANNDLKKVIKNLEQYKYFPDEWMEEFLPYLFKKVYSNEWS